MSAIQHVQIRQPATANLMIDSLDGPTIGPNGTVIRKQYADNFIIQQNQSILNGFFHRIATTEVVVNWTVPNISSDLGNNVFSVQVTAIGSPIYDVTLPDNFYTVAECLDLIVAVLNASGTGLTWSIDSGAGVQAALVVASGAFSVLPGLLQAQLAITPNVSGNTRLITSPDLRPFKYLDFVSPQLTYNQKLKDATSSSSDRGVLCRFYFSWDQPPTYDTYGFPILMGYTAFSLRRLFNPPKQIRWENNMPAGQLGFQVFGDTNKLLSASIGLQIVRFSWLMTLQVSED